MASASPCGDITISPSTRPLIARNTAAMLSASREALDTSKCNSRARAATSMPRINSDRYSPCISGTTAPTVCVRRVIRLRATLDGVKRNSEAASSTRRRVSGVTLSCPFNARETVATET